MKSSLTVGQILLKLLGAIFTLIGVSILSNVFYMYQHILVAPYYLISNLIFGLFFLVGGIILLIIQTHESSLRKSKEHS